MKRIRLSASDRYTVMVSSAPLPLAFRRTSSLLSTRLIFGDEQSAEPKE